MASEYGSWPVRGGCAPDADDARGAARRFARRQDGRAEMLEWHFVPKEQRFVGHHRLDHRRHQRFGVAAFEHGHQFAEGAEAGLARHRQQSALGQVLLVG
jgi:hypothetical protein